MEKRKIQSTGGGTYIVSLPKKWIIKHKLKQKDDINLFVKEDGAIVLTPIKKKSVDIKKIECAGQSVRYIIRKMIGAYINGADKIEINGVLSRADKRLIKSSAKDMLIGVEIVEETDTICLECLIDISKLSNRKIFENAYKSSNWMQVNVFTALYDNDKILAKDVIEQDCDVDRLTILAIRLLNLAAKNPRVAECVDITGGDSLNYRALINYIEMMADYCVNMAYAIIDMINMNISIELKKNIIATSKDISNIYADAFYSFWNKKPKLADATIENAIKIEKTILSIDNKNKILTDKTMSDMSDAVGAVAIILDNLGSILHISKNICELVIDMGEDGSDL